MEQGYIWKLDDGNEYTVISIVEENNKKYIYLINRSEIQKYIIAEYNEDKLVSVKDPDLLEKLIIKFNENLKETLPKLIEEYM